MPEPYCYDGPCGEAARLGDLSVWWLADAVSWAASVVQEVVSYWVQGSMLGLLALGILAGRTMAGGGFHG